MIADIMTKALGPDLHYRTTARMMGQSSQMSKYSEDELQATMKSFDKLTVDDTKNDEPEDVEPEAIENADLVIADDPDALVYY